MIFVEQITGLPGVNIDFPLDGDRGNILMNFLCNQTGYHYMNANFLVEGIVGDALTISGYSHYGKIKGLKET